MSEELVKLFISYCHTDEKLREQLDKHLAPLKGQKVIEAWHDRQIQVGDEWGNQIDDRLNNADIILLLVSPDFVASEYCSNIELKQAVKRHENGDAIVVPVILEPCDWSWLPFAKFQAFPKDGKAITTWGNQNEAFLDVAQGIRKVAQEIFAKRQQKLQQKKADRAEYKSKVEELLSPTGREISPADQDTLDELSEKLGLTEEEIKTIVDNAYQPYKEQETKLQKYIKTLKKYIDNDKYPFSDDVKDELASRQKSLGIKDEDLKKVTQSILDQAKEKYQEKLQAEAAERQRQSALDAETKKQLEQQHHHHHQEHESKLRYYEEEFSKAVQGIYPLNESAWNGLRAFQQSLELNAEDVERIEHHILAETETKYQKKLQAAERQRQLELEAEEQRQQELEQAEYEQKLQRYEQEFSQAIAAQYPIVKSVQAWLTSLQQSLELRNEDVDRIEEPLIAPKKAVYQQRLADEQRSNKEVERQLELERQQKLEQQRQAALFRFFKGL
jgi:TIR domain